MCDKDCLLTRMNRSLDLSWCEAECCISIIENAGRLHPRFELPDGSYSTMLTDDEVCALMRLLCDVSGSLDFWISQLTLFSGRERESLIGGDHEAL